MAKETGFGIEPDSLDEIILEKDINVLSRYGGVKGVVRKLRADADNGLQSDVVRNPHLVLPSLCPILFPLLSPKPN